MIQLLFCIRFLPIISEMATCDPPCTNENTCYFTTCECYKEPRRYPYVDSRPPPDTACTGDQICQNGNCGVYFTYTE